MGGSQLEPARADLDAPPPADRRVLAASAVLTTGAFLALLDTTVASVAVNRIARQFGSPLTTVSWVMTGYGLAVAAGIPLSGWLMDRLGGRRAWMLTTAGFLVASAFAGVSWSIGALIAFRVLQGFTGGLIEPISQAMISRTAGRRRVTRVLAFAQLIIMLAPVSGPAVGGALLQIVSWRWLFFLNIPIGIVVLLLARRLIPADDVHLSDKARLDAVGLGLLSPGAAFMVYGFSRIVDSGVGSSGFLVPAAIGTALLVGYGVHASRTRHEPIIDLRLFANRQFINCAVALFFLGFTLAGGLFLVPLQGHLVVGTHDLGSGLLVVPQGLGALLVLPLLGTLLDRYDARVIAPAGMALAGVSTLIYSQLDAGTSPWIMGCLMLVRGFGTGSTFAPALGAAYQVIDEKAIGRATSALFVLLQLGATIGTACTALVLSNRMTHLVSGVSVKSTLPAFNPANVAPLSVAFNQTFLVVAATCFIPVAAALFTAGRYKPAESG